MKCRKTCTGLEFDLEHFNGPQTKFICDSLYKHPVLIWGLAALHQYDRKQQKISLTFGFKMFPIETTTVYSMRL